MADRPINSWRARAAVSEALDVFNSSYMQEVWAKALARREADPEGAVTSARTLLETLCKHILDAAGTKYDEGLPLPKLYRLAAGVLDIAPTDHTEPIFKSLFQACAEIVDSIGRLRNHLSDSHGRGPFGTMPDWRHAELAVNLSGAIATYLAAVWKGRQPTVADVIRTFIEKTEETKPLGESHRYTLERIARSTLGGVIASKLQVSDVIGYCEQRLAEGVTPATNTQDVVYLRRALGEASTDVIDRAIVMLRGMKMMAKSVPRTRRPSHAEYDALINLYRKQGLHGKTKIPMAEIMEFAVWSGRTLGEICQLRWSDVDLEKGTCKLPGTSEEFPLLGRALEVLKARRQKFGTTEPAERVFPYNRPSIVQRHVGAKKRLGATLADVGNFRFNDLRYEAVSRLLESGVPPHTVARATGQDIKKVMQVFEKIDGGGGA